MKKAHFLLAAATVACIMVAAPSSYAQSSEYAESLVATLTIQQPLYQYQRVVATFSATNTGNRSIYLISGRDDSYMKIKNAGGNVYSTNTSRCTPGPGLLKPGESHTSSFYLTSVGDKETPSIRAALGYVYAPGEYSATMEVQYSLGDTDLVQTKLVETRFTIADVTPNEEALHQAFMLQMDSIYYQRYERSLCCDLYDNVILSFLEQHRESRLRETWLIAAITRSNVTCTRVTIPLSEAYLLEFIERPNAWTYAYNLKAFGASDTFLAQLTARYPGHKIVEYLGKK